MTLLESFHRHTGEKLSGSFPFATADEIVRAAEAASNSGYENVPGPTRAAFLRAIADEIEALGATLVETVMAESALPEARVVGERGRTCGQLRSFAALVEKEDWRGVKHETAEPDRQPIPKPDLRKTLVPLGPIVVFGASNFPLAFSVAGGDTAAALAAGCPVIVKGHDAHPNTCQLVADCIHRAAKKCEIPSGAFQLVFANHEQAQQLVQNENVEGVGFTGSKAVGRLLFNLAAQRERPIPVFAEMGSINPVFFLPRVLSERPVDLATSYFGSLTMGVGQFCTNPGLIVAVEGPALDALRAKLVELVNGGSPSTMLTDGIAKAFAKGVSKLQADSGLLAKGSPAEAGEASPALFETTAHTFIGNPALSEEVFGPAALLVVCQSKSEMSDVARSLEGQLTATLQGNEADKELAKSLVQILTRKVGRLIYNGYPTGLEVCPAMHHGGPYPATTDSRFTAVGTDSIYRWTRSICYQNIPTELL